MKRCECSEFLVNGKCPTCDRLRRPRMRLIRTVSRERAREQCETERGQWLSADDMRTARYGVRA